MNENLQNKTTPFLPYRAALLLISVFVLGGCVTMLRGTVSTASYSQPPPQLSFAVVPPDFLSLIDRTISALIEQKMLERGYTKATSPKEADVAVLYRHSIGPPRTDVSSGPDFVWGGQRTESTTSYPRLFEIALVDLKNSKMPEKLEMIWQGEVRSRGQSENLSKLAPHFIDVLFENFGITATNKSFKRVFEQKSPIQAVLESYGITAK